MLRLALALVLQSMSALVYLPFKDALLLDQFLVVCDLLILAQHDVLQDVLILSVRHELDRLRPDWVAQNGLLLAYQVAVPLVYMTDGRRALSIHLGAVVTSTG